MEVLQMENTDSYVGKIIKVGASLGVTIPERNCQFSGLKEGDMIQVWYRKKEEWAGHAAYSHQKIFKRD